eukprot:scaffold357_cov239-Pinguiococcus_pyrenoidosus.AAC.3
MLAAYSTGSRKLSPSSFFLIFLFFLFFFFLIFLFLDLTNVAFGRQRITEASSCGAMRAAGERGNVKGSEAVTRGLTKPRIQAGSA